MTHQTRARISKTEILDAYRSEDPKVMREVVLSPDFISALANTALQARLDRPLDSFLGVYAQSLSIFRDNGVICSVRDVIVNGRESVNCSSHSQKLLSVANSFEFPVFERGHPYLAAGVANNLGRVNLRSFYHGDIPLQGQRNNNQRSQMVITVANVLSEQARDWIEPAAFDMITEAIAPVVDTFAEVQARSGRLMLDRYCHGGY